jgi:fatty-acyl-CoA synthase
MRLFPQPLLDALVEAPERTAFEHGRRRVSYDETLTMVRRMTTGLRRAGLGQDRAVAMVVSLTPEAFAAHLAAHTLGAVVVGVRPGWTASQLSAVLDRVDAVVVDDATATPELLELAGSAAVLSLGDCPGAEDLLAAPDDGLPITVEAQAHDVARVNFTSGSSGRPKGCAWSYEALHPAFDPSRWPPDLARLISCFERCLVYGSWSMPAMMTFAGRSLLVGGTVVVGAKDERPDLPHAIERHRISGALTLVPALHRMLEMLQTQPVDISCLRALVVTGSPATTRLLADAVARLGPVVWQGYGQSESGMISLLTPDHIGRSGSAALESVGKVLPHVEVSVRDAVGRPVSPGAIGQIFVRSRQLMVGYWGEYAAQTSDVSRDGWLDTRDIGYLTPNGFLHLTSRAREVIMVEGHVRYAAPIERILAGHPDVDQAYVVGAPDEQTGEAVHAFVIPRAGRVLDPDALSSLIRVELGGASVPSSISAVADVPLTPGGKPDKDALLRDLRHRHVDPPLGPPPGGSLGPFHPIG